MDKSPAIDKGEKQRSCCARYFSGGIQPPPSARWWWNHALNLCIETYKTTGKGLSQSALNTFVPKLKRQQETQWLSECYSQVLQATTLNLVTAYKNFFEGRAKYLSHNKKIN
ncbi:MAG TPA: helix-turn-helix domain-containing protein [Leptolyngbyaceae cyanobacterium]